MDIISTEFIYNENNIFFTLFIKDRYITEMIYYYINIGDMCG